MIRGIVTDIKKSWVEVKREDSKGNRYVLHYNPAEVDDDVQLGDLVEVRVSRASTKAIAALALKEIKEADDFVLIGGIGFSISTYMRLREKPKSSNIDQGILDMLEQSRQAIISILDRLNNEKGKDEL